MMDFIPKPIRSAMTLIEVMISLILSLTILLVLAATYRVISQGIALVTAWSNENSLLRTGFLLALEDADYWHSNADADPPYEKDFLREEPPILAAADTDPGRQSLSRRPFRPIRFSKSLDPNPPDEKNPSGFGLENLVFYATPRKDGVTEVLLNPNAFLPHDPRSWYRNNLFPNEVANVTGLIPRLVYGDYALMAATDMATTHEDAWGKRFDGGLKAYTEKVDRLHDHQALPRLAWEIFQFLHYRGMPEYLRNGTPWVIMDPQGLLPNGSATVPTIPAAPTTRRDAFPPEPNQTIPEPWASNYGFIFGYIPTGNSNDMPWLHWSPRNGGSNKDQVRGAADWMAMLGSDLPINGTAACFVESAFPGFFVPGQHGDESWYDRTQQGWFSDQRGPVIPYHSWSNVANGGAQMQLSHGTDYSSTTVRVPYNLSDANRSAYKLSPTLTPNAAGNWARLQDSIDYSSKPRQTPTMSTHIERLHEVLGSALVIHRVRVQPPGGNVIELIFTHATTTWRGARQHWRLRYAMDPSQQPIGDYYE